VRITSFGHACLLVETDDARVLIDPGTYSSGFEALSGLDAVLLTHQHPDHADAGRLANLMNSNPDAQLLAEPETVTGLETVSASALASGDERMFGGLTIAAVGGRHAPNHDLVAPLGNIGLLVTERAGATLFHPGDSYADTPPGVDILAFPLNAPWTRVSETLEFLRRVSAPVELPIHDGLLNDAGRAMYLMHATNFGPAGSEVHDLSDHEPYDG
jgi:L-ascorbate metabolism protein UlaG (beta-lactamase superfamily)